MIDYNIIATGSKGNAVVIDQKILIDCGVSFKALSKVYRALKLVLLTHIHSDHFQPTTLRLLAENRPTLRFACCAWLCKPLVDAGVPVSQIDVLEPGHMYGYALPSGQGGCHMTGRLVDMAFTLGGKQRVTLEINGDFCEIWDKLHQEPVLDVEIKKHREKRSLSANAYFHVLCNKISAETGESEDAVKRRLVVSYGALARDKDGKPVGLKLPPTVDPSDFYPYVRLYETRQENGKDYSCYFVYKESHKMDSKEFAHLVDGAIEEAKELGIQTDTPEQLARYKEEWSK